MHRVTARQTTSLLMAGLFVLAAIPVSGQQTRAEAIAQQQAEKSKRLAPNRPTTGERVLEWFESHFTDPNAVYLTFGGIYPTGGLAPGIAVRRAIGHARLNVGAAYSTRGYKLAHGSLRFPELANGKIEIGTSARWLDATQVPFYGLGNESAEDERVNYRLRSVDVGANAALKPVPWFRIGVGVAARRPEDRAGLGSRPSIETRHSPLTAPGLRSDPQYLQATALTAIDWRESAGYTRRGGLYSVAFDQFRDRDDALTFRLLTGDFRQYLPLLNEHWVLAFRALVQTTDTDSGSVIPYYMLPSLGGAQTLRGYGDFRFQDRHLLLLSGEYRWLPSRVVDMAIFVDAGKVTSERRDLDLDGLKTSYGIGIRFHGPNFTPLRADLARGDEGIRLHVTGSIGF